MLQIPSYKYVLGIDEVGRGCLAGPVYLSGALLSSSYPLYTFHHEIEQNFESCNELKIVRDSKRLSQANREKVVHHLLSHEIKHLTLTCSNILIDTYGIGQCLSYMMALIITQLADDDTLIIVDGLIKIHKEFNYALLEALYKENPTLDIDLSRIKPCSDIIRQPKADDIFLSVALASNIAKVSRDLYMEEQGKNYPEFKWHQNKGYATKAHREAIKMNRENPFLRKSFCKNIFI